MTLQNRERVASDATNYLLQKPAAQNNVEPGIPSLRSRFFNSAGFLTGSFRKEKGQERIS
jgi:hypothetical protein